MDFVATAQSAGRLALAALLLAAAPAAGASEAPILRVETGMHTAAIKSIAVDAADRFLVTGSEDKTVRVWDIATGELLRVLRPPIGEGNEGEINAVAITPDGELIAAGGWTSPSGLQNNVYLFERRTGRLVRRLAGLPNVVLHLAFSHDGQRLAATLGGANGLRVFRASDGAELFRDTEPETSYWADFDRAGRLVTSSSDGRLRLYDADHRKLADSETPGGRKPFGVAFSPDGGRIAVGYSDRARIDVVSGTDLRWLFSPNTSGISHPLSSVAWSADGVFLFAAGRHQVGDHRYIRRWSQYGGGRSLDLQGPPSAVMDLRSLSDGRLVYGSQDPAWGVLASSGERILHRGSRQADLRGRNQELRINLRGEWVVFAYRRTESALFSIPRRLFDPHYEGKRYLKGEPFAPPPTSAPGLDLSWESTTEPRVNGKVLPLEPKETSLSLAVAADGGSFLLGTDRYLRAFRSDGTELWPEPRAAPGPAWAVHLTVDGRLALAAFGDGTIRWFRARDGVELLALFAYGEYWYTGSRSSSRYPWVLWTPGGYYDASGDGEDLIGWHVNRGPDQAADFLPASQLRDAYRRPDVIDQVLETLDVAEAVRSADLRRAPLAPPPPPPIPPPPPPSMLPVVTILEPSEGSEVSTPTVKLRVNVRLPSGARLDRLRVSIDGHAVTTREIVWEPSASSVDTRDIYVEREIPVPQRDCTIEVVAEAAGLLGEPALRKLRWAAPTPERRAWVLAVGVSKYQRPEYQLGFAAKDATDLAGAWKALEGRAFSTVETRVLTDANATLEAILDGFDWLSSVAAVATDDDLMVLFLAGHGVSEAGQYYFLPHDADPARRSRTFLSQSQLHDVLNTLPRRVLLFLDTCRAGSFAGRDDRELRARVDPTAFAKDMAYAGVLVFSATAARQLSQESPDWGNGAFTKALVEALTAAKHRQSKLTSTDLERHLYETVGEMTEQAQTPTVAKAGLPDIVLVPGSR